MLLQPLTSTAAAPAGHAALSSGRLAGNSNSKHFATEHFAVDTLGQLSLFDHNRNNQREMFSPSFFRNEKPPGVRDSLPIPGTSGRKRMEVI